DWKASADAYQAALLRVPESQPIAKAQILRRIGESHYAHNDWPAAETYYLQALSERRRIGADLGIAAALHDLGAATWRSGDLPRAEKYFLESLTIRKRLIPASLPVASTLQSLGNVILYDLGRAQEYFREAIAIQENLAPDSLTLVFTLNNAGVAAWYRG